MDLFEQMQQQLRNQIRAAPSKLRQARQRTASWQALLRADDEVADPLDILHHVLLRVEPRHLVLEDADTDRVRRRGDITMARHILLNALCIRSVRARWRVLERETSGRLGDRSAHTPWIDGRDTQAG